MVTLLYVLAFAVIPAASQETVKTPTFQLNVENFEEQITSHELSVVAFYTKHSRFTSLLKAMFANLTEAYKSNDKLLVGLVDIDENVELTTYTDHNMIDIMIFYPEFVLNPLRYSRNFTAAAIKDEVDYCWQYSNSELALWRETPKLVSRFMDAAFKGKGNAGDIADQARQHLEKLKTYYEIVNNATADSTTIAVRANELRLELFNMRRIQLNNEPQGFLDKKRLLFFYDSMLKLLFTEQKEMPKMKQKRKFVTNKVKAKIKQKQKKIEQEVEAVM